MKVFLALFILCLNSNLWANICLDFKVPDSEFYDFVRIDDIKTIDQIKLSANVLIPKNLNTKAPAIIFGNSWLLDEHEYLLQARQFAKEGYIVLSYSLRGWGCSEGIIDVIGPNDVSDFKSVLSWLIENTNVDEENIGVIGISYGGGLALMMAAKDVRIKTAVAMSAWGSLEEAIYANEVPRNFWGKFLIYTGKLIGNASKEIDHLFKSLISGKDINEVQKWAAQRSPVNFISEVNKRKIPIMIANNFGDNLFQVNNVLDYFNKLKGPKKLVLSQGTHASAELGGLFGIDNTPFNYARKWMNYWLKGIENEFVLGKNDIVLERDLSNEYEKTSSKKFNKKFFKKYLRPEGLFFSGVLDDSAVEKAVIDSLHFGNRDSFATTGIPIVTAIADAHFKYPQFELIPGIVRAGGFIFKSETFEKDVKLRGNISAQLNISSTSDNIQLSVYVYDVGPMNIAKLITHGTFAKRNITPDVFYKIQFDLVTTAYDLEEGHQLVFAIDAHDPLYSDLLSRFTTQKFRFDSQAFIKFPYY